MQQFIKLIVSAVFIFGLAGIGSLSALATQVEQNQAGQQRVARGIFSTNILDREPTDQVLILSNTVRQIYFFTDLRHYQGQTITHRWEYEGEVVSEKSFEVGGPRWRVYSQMELDPSMTGTWTVVVSDGRGWPIYAAIFHYVEKVAGNEKGIILPLED
ncbi:MAG: DUF2914 domain-containing protein [Gammaproteobacteria bacterium]